MPQPTAVILTALPVEYDAVRAHLTNVEELVHVDGTRVERGGLDGTSWSVAVAELGEGALNAAALTTRIVDWLAPQALFFVGVAGGLKDGIEIGDVVVGTKVYAIHGGKVTPEGFQARPEVWYGSHRLAQAARSALRDLPDVRAHHKPIAVGDVVLADDRSALAAHIRQHYNDACAIEMEGSGAAHAAHLKGQLDTLVIRGVSDRANPDKHRADASGSQELAAKQAAAVAVAVLRKHLPYRDFSDPETVHGPVPVATTALPPRPLGFTGRSAELGRLLPHLAPTQDKEAALPLLIFAVTGMGGIGKTALAVEAAHRADANGWFPGGTLFVDLRGYDDDPVTADQAVLALLDALGVRGPDLPQTAARQYDTYRALLAERRRTLVILDNASHPSQFLPLLPGTRHHRVLITSRDRPYALPLRLIDLEALTPDESVDLVTRALHDTDERDDRPSREPAALRELTDLCGHLPLALQIAAAMLRLRRQRAITSLVSEIAQTGDATTVLDNCIPCTDLYGRSLVLRPVLEASYRRLPPDQARLLRLLSLAPGAETGTEAVAALSDLDSQTALSLLEDLAATHLVTAVRDGDASESPVRWRMHDLVRAYGAGVVAGDAQLREEGEAARGRVLEHYCRWADAADRRLRWLPGWPEPERFGDRRQALAWLDGERSGLVAAAQWAREERHAEAAVRLSECLPEYLVWRRYFDDTINISGIARQAAHRAGDGLGEALAWSHLGLAQWEVGRAGEAIEALTCARDLFQAVADRHGEAGAWNNLGAALWEVGRVADAIEALTCARDLFQAVADRHGEAGAWNNLGIALWKAGQVGDAIDAHTRARDLSQTAADRHGEATAWNNLGNALGEAGRTEEAIEAYGEALEAYEAFEDWYGAGRTLGNLARTHEAAHRPAEARTHWLRAAEAYTRANAPDQAAHARARAENLK